MRTWWAVSVLASRQRNNGDVEAKSKLLFAKAYSKEEAIGLTEVQDLVDEGFSRDYIKIAASQCPKDDA